MFNYNCWLFVYQNIKVIIFFLFYDRILWGLKDAMLPEFFFVLISILRPNPVRKNQTHLLEKKLNMQVFQNEIPNCILKWIHFISFHT